MWLRLIWPTKGRSFLVRVFNERCSMNLLFQTSSFRRGQFHGISMLNLQKFKLQDMMQIGSSSPCGKRTKCVRSPKEVSNHMHHHHFNVGKVVDEWIQHLRQSKSHFGEAIFVLGPMGVGKSTVVTEEFRKHKVYKDFIYVDTDEVMENLEGFEMERVKEFYKIARSVAIHLTDWLLNERQSFITEGTCVQYLELEDYMWRLKNKGYDIKVKHVNSISLEEILRRTGKRKRKISDDVVESIYYGSLKGISELQKINVDNCLFQEI